MNSPNAPTLAAPGAGLPAPELWIARGLFALKRRFGSREAFTARFEQERATIRQLLPTCGPARRGEQVLIPRLCGLEDSSRFWSVWMTLEHLRITNTVFATVIQSLVHGQVPTKKASTADVKPRADLTADVEAAYEASCDELLTTVAAISDLKTAAKYAHPWFGPLDAAGWHALTATHMAIHRTQIARIVAGL
ncbi:MAG: DinB family protein [Verrucomicrobiaceae bacterium]|nr:DinB family protein [Verrucomicrobiaceae bacterium]